MQSSGLVEVQSHTYWHPNFQKELARLADADYKAFVAGQLTRSKEVLESQLGVRVDALAWPFGIYDPYLEEAAKRAGYETAFAFEGGPAHAGCDMFAIPRIPVSFQTRIPAQVSLSCLSINKELARKSDEDGRSAFPACLRCSWQCLFSR
jgi:peptidoglycan/xylan/chitin deacetylase (PgdA/CDA1 family)